MNTIERLETTWENLFDLADRRMGDANLESDELTLIAELAATVRETGCSVYATEIARATDTSWRREAAIDHVGHWLSDACDKIDGM